MDSHNESLPLQGKVFCCTAVDPDQRNKIVQAIEAMGGVHKTNLMSDVQYLIVGSRETEKYEYAARHRGDMAFLVPDFLPELYQHWIENEEEGSEELDIESELNKGKLGVFEKLKVCFTNISGSREDLIKLVEQNKGQYLPDLTRQVTHLVSPTKVGKKYQYGKKWGTTIVSPEWLFQSVERGTCLDPVYYSPDLPADQIGKGAFIDKSLHRRGNNIIRRKEETSKQAWDSILEKIERPSQTRQNPENKAWADRAADNDDDNDDDDNDGDEGPEGRGDLPPLPDSEESDNDNDNQKHLHNNPSDRPKRGIFDGNSFHLYGFNDRQLKILSETITSNFGQINEDTTTPVTFFIINSKHGYKPQSKIPPSASIATERMIERSLYKRELIFDEWGEYVESRHIEEFWGMRVATSGFSGVEELQLPKLLELIGASPQTVFNKDCELLIAKPDSRKVRFALYWDIPVVNVDWLFECMKQNRMLDLSSPRFVLDGKEAPGRKVDRKLHSQEGPNNKNKHDITNGSSDGNKKNKGTSRAISIDSTSTTNNGPTSKREKTYYDYMESTTASDDSTSKRQKTANYLSSRSNVDIKRRDRKLVGRAATSNIPGRNTDSIDLTESYKKNNNNKYSNSVFEEDNKRPKRGGEVRYAEEETRKDRKKLLEALGGDFYSQPLTQDEDQPQMSPATDVNTSFQESLAQQDRLRTRT